MSRSLKNILMVICLVLMVCINFFTITYVNDDIYTRVYPQDNLGISNNNFEIGKVPGMPDGDIPERENGKIPEPNGDMPPMQNGDIQLGNNLFHYEIDTTASFLHYLLFALEGVIIGSILVYLIMSRFNKKKFKETFKNSDKIIIFFLSVILISNGITMLSVNMAEEYELPWLSYDEKYQENDEVKAEDIDVGVIVDKKKIDLNDYSSNITINKAGEYTLSGKLNYSILVNAKDDVILNLDNVEIKSGITSAIANISSNKLIIKLVDNSNNKLVDGGYSEYDGCIYSDGDLVIKGNGKLEVYGLQTDGEGIATNDSDIIIDAGNIYIESNDDGINAGGDNGGTITINNGDIFIKASGDGVDSNKDIVINGGVVYSIGSSRGGDAGMDADDGFELNGGEIIVLGSDMLEVPSTLSKQNSISFNLNKVISKGTLVTLVNDNKDVIVSFETKEDFKTLIISSGMLKSGSYNLYIGGKNTGNLINGVYRGGEFSLGEKVTIGGIDKFIVDKVITKIN